jgi:hypothetical protein
VRRVLLDIWLDSTCRSAYRVQFVVFYVGKNLCHPAEKIVSVAPRWNFRRSRRQLSVIVVVIVEGNTNLPQIADAT